MSENRANIPTFQAPVRPIEVPRGGIEAYSQAAYRLGRGAQIEHEYATEEGRELETGAHQLGAGLKNLGEQIQAHETSQEIIAGFGRIGSGVNSLMQKWNQIAVTPAASDPETSAKFRDQQLEPFLQQFEGQFQTPRGQMWAAERANSIRQEFNRVMTADMATAAGHAAVTNTSMGVNQLSGMVATNTSMLDWALGQVDPIFSESSVYANMKPETAAVLRNQGALAAKKSILGAALKGMLLGDPMTGDPPHPEMIEALQKSGKYDAYITGEEWDRLRQTAAGVQKQMDTQAEHNQEQANKALRRQTDADINSLMLSSLGPNGALNLPQDYDAQVRRIVGNATIPGTTQSVMKPGETRALINFGQKMRNAPLQTNEGAFTDLYHRMLLPSNDPERATIGDVLQAGAQDQLSAKDFRFLSQVARDYAQGGGASIPDVNFENLLNTERSKLLDSPNPAFVPAGQRAMWADYRNRLLDDYMSYGHQNPDEYFDPESKNYILKRNPEPLAFGASGVQKTPIGPPKPPQPSEWQKFRDWFHQLPGPHL